MELNTEQRKAVYAPHGPLMVLAGAGTGKTTSIVHRIKYFIKELGVSPQQILVLTYTVKAAENMTSSIEKHIGSDAVEIQSKNFHSFLMDLLDRHYNVIGYKDKPHLIEDSMIEFLISENYSSIPRFMSKKFALDRQYATRKIKGILGSFSDNLISAERLHSVRSDLMDKISLLDDKTAQENYAQLIDAIDILPLYNKWKMDVNGVDFGDIIYLSYRILSENTDILNEYRDRYRYVFIDEFQDSYLALLRIMEILVDDRTSITVVGDDDQSIYSFKGASKYNLIGFRERYGAYENFSLVELFTNYRSTQPILDTANSLIGMDDNRIKSSSLKSIDSSGSDVRLILGDKEEQVDWVVRKVKSLIETTKSDDIAVLTRTNSQLVSIRESFDIAKIPVADSSISVSSTNLSKDINELVDIISYNDIRAVHSIYSQLCKRYEIPLHNIDSYKIRYRDGLYVSKRRSKHVEKLLSFINSMIKNSSKMNLHRTIDEIIKFIGIVNDDTNSKVIEIYHSLVDEYLKLYRNKGFAHFSRYLSIKMMSNELSIEIEGNSKGVNLMTVHKSKGKEFDIVFIPFLRSNSFPLNYSSDRWPIEFISSLEKETLDSFDPKKNHTDEERRILFVAITRAAQELYLLGSQKGLSKLVKEIDESLLHKTTLPGLDIVNTGERVISYDLEHPISFSASSISAYIECPLKYKHQYIDMIPQHTKHYLVSGILAHSALEKAFEENSFRDKDIAESVHVAAQDFSFDTNHQKDAVINDVVEMVTRYTSSRSEGNIKSSMIEKKFNLDINGNRFTGKVDRIDITDDGHLNIIDYKTSSSYKSKKQLRKDIQMGIYALFAIQGIELDGEIYKSLPEQVSIIYLKKESDHMVSTEINTSDLELILDEIDTAVDSIKQNNFTPKVGGHCMFCSYREKICYKYNNLLEIRDTS